MDRLKKRFRPKPVDANGSSASERENDSTHWYHRPKKKKDRQQDPYSTPSRIYKDSNTELSSLWDRAYNILKSEDGQLVEKYEKLLSVDFLNNG